MAEPITDELSQLLESKLKLESAACKAIDKDKENLFEAAARKLEPIYARIDEIKKQT